MRRAEYNRGYTVDLEFDAEGRVAERLVNQWRTVRGRRVGICILYQMLDRASGRFKNVARYDDSAGQFHLHPPNAPKTHVPINDCAPGQEFAYARADIELNREHYLKLALAVGIEVYDEADSSEH